jgi:hypothetical protein
MQASHANLFLTIFFVGQQFLSGMVSHERIGFSYLVSQKYTGEKALVKVLCDSKVHEFKIRLATHKRLVAAHVKGRPPSYYIVAAFVFVAISVPYLRSEVCT